MTPVYLMGSYPNHNPYGVDDNDVDLFTVVRNPYERLISDYYYWGNVRSKKNNNKNITNTKNWESDEVQFNHRIHLALTGFRKNPDHKNYFTVGGHMIPQYDFVYNNTNKNTKIKKKKIIKNVLRFEFLGQEFQTLMELYNLPMLVLPNHTIGHTTSNNKVLGIQNLTNKNMVLIETIYRNDFLEFEYEMLSSPRIE